MTLALSQYDQSLVAAATRALVSPLVAPSFESWLAEVNRTMKELVWADTATFMFPVSGSDVKAVSDMYTSPAMRQYMLEKQPEIERRWGARTRALTLGSFNRTTLYAERIGELYASDYYNEYLVPHRAYDVLGLTTSLGAPDRVVNLYFHHERPTGRRFGARGASLARMLFPAFKAGVHASHTTFQRGHRLGHLADAMTTGVALGDGMGRIVHRNPALLALLQSEPQRPAIESALIAAAQESALVLCAANGHAGTSQTRVASLPRLRRRISGIAGVYTLTATALDHEPVGVRGRGRGDGRARRACLVPGGAAREALSPDAARARRRPAPQRGCVERRGRLHASDQHRDRPPSYRSGDAQARNLGARADPRAAGCTLRGASVTYSIIARDPETGALGGAVQSHLVNAGIHTLFGEAGIGIVIAQMMADRAYGMRGLEAMQGGRGASDALASALALDPASSTRQVAMLDAVGGVGAFTGAQCVAHSSHLTGNGVSVQGAMCRSAETPRAMLAAFTAARGPFADRLVAALDAAERAGGDMRGQRAAAILIVSGTVSTEPWRDRLVDLRVEDHPRALDELRRLVALHRLNARANDALELALGGRAADSLTLFAELEAENPEDPDVAFRHALVLTLTGAVDHARERLEHCYRLHDGWRELISRLPAAGLVPDDPAIVARLAGPGQSGGGASTKR